jgi:hypothetical protein
MWELTFKVAWVFELRKVIGHKSHVFAKIRGLPFSVILDGV